MPLTGEEIRANLTRFVAQWSVREGYEKGEAQEFLIDLFACYGQKLSDVAGFESFQEGGFVDLLWPRVCIFEMKSAGEASRLAKHRDQALDYWRGAADPEANLPAPEYVVLCAFRRFEVWEPPAAPSGTSREARRALSDVRAPRRGRSAEPPSLRPAGGVVHVRRGSRADPRSGLHQGRGRPDCQPAALQRR